MSNTNVQAVGFELYAARMNRIGVGPESAHLGRNDLRQQILKLRERFFQTANRFAPEFHVFQVLSDGLFDHVLGRVAAGAAEEFFILRQEARAFFFEHGVQGAA